jgi:Adenylate and Guanylate cyclase catalytic domain/3'5'-cyclic nucleotide phosphodiesterase
LKTKVESVGDCYVAVCGLPEPREDHAVVMAKFAKDCQRRVRELMPKLEATLGPDTSEISIRFGLHSGPVIAGVLRGERARFQLFGDTMNTASRVETTSEGGKIHISQECAEHLIGAGKSGWVEKRQDKVYAKGKGAIETYWLVTTSDKTRGISGHPSRPARKSASIASSETDGDRVGTIDTGGATLTSTKTANEKVQRLVDWNCELLLPILKRIVARRRGKRRRSTLSAQTQERIRQREAELTSNRNLLDELVEVIPLPPYDAQAAKDEQAFERMELGENVVSELREFISLIASMYRDDNPFHNWEHASHVTMSVNKLLARIVAPDSIAELQNESTEKDVGSVLYDHTYGITADPLIQFAIVLSALIHDVDHRGTKLQLSSRRSSMTLITEAWSAIDFP